MPADLDTAPYLPPPAGIRDGLAFIKARLLQPVTVQGAAMQAIAETAEPFNDSHWYWTDDNAKALELLALPAVRNAEPALADSVLDFVLVMSPGEAIWRRLAAPQIQARRLDPRDFLVVTPFHSFEGDLSRGVLRQSSRFNDGRERVAAVHTGHLLEFQLGGRKHCIDVEDSITDCGLLRTVDGITLFHESTIEAPASLLSRQAQPVATLRYSYDIRADSAAILLRVTLRALAGIQLSQLRLTTACDALSDVPRTCHVGAGGTYATPKLPPAGAAYLHRGPLQQLLLAEAGNPGFAHTLHLRPRQPDQVVSLSATTREDGRLQWVVLRHAASRLPAGGEFAIAEDRLLLAGGDLAQAPTVMSLLDSREAMAGIDPSASYDHGAELNAVATYWRHGMADRYATPVPPERLAALRAWLDRHLDAFFAAVTPQGDAAGHRVYVRGLAFVILALDTMLRGTGEARYRLALGAALDLLLQCQQRGANDGVFFDSGGNTGYLDCHAAGILALARLVEPGCDARIAPALRRALAALRLGTIMVPAGGASLPYDTIVVRSRMADGGWTEDGAFWTYKAALLLRALRVVLSRRAASHLDLSPAEADRVVTFARACSDRLATTARRHSDGVEHLTSPHAGEGNSETQAWVLLAEAEATAEEADAAIAAVAAITGSADPAPAPDPAPMPAPANVPEPSPELLHEARTLRINVKMLAATLAQARLAGLTETATLPGVPRRFGLGSRICCQADIEQDWLRHWCRALGTSPRYHRKLWEDCFVPQALWEAGMLEPGRRGLGFAVGTEDLPAFFVGRGIEVLATDLDASDDRADAWRDSGQHANRAQNLYRPRLAKAAECDRLLGFRAVDMTAIPEDLLQGRFDFVWSICALEHLGSLEAGEDFIRSAMRCLRPGGTAVHTTEYNMDQDRPTLATGPTVLYQRRHLDRLARALAADGHAMRPLQDPPGGQHLFDQLVDVPPYPHEGGPQDAPHLRLTLGGYTTTSVGLIIQAGAA